MQLSFGVVASCFLHPTATYMSFTLRFPSQLKVSVFLIQTVYFV